jgi:quercetin dioxygenase-like cupin family protein
MKRAAWLVAGVVLGVAGSAVAAQGLVTTADRAPVRSPAGSDAQITLLAQGDNAFLGKLELPPGAAVPEHRDATEEYIHVLSGGGVITLDGVAHTLAAGDTVYMPADATVSYVNGDAPLVAIQVFAGPGPAAKYQSWEPVSR